MTELKAFERVDVAAVPKFDEELLEVVFGVVVTDKGYAQVGKLDIAKEAEERCHIHHWRPSRFKLQCF